MIKLFGTKRCHLALITDPLGGFDILTFYSPRIFTKRNHPDLIQESPNPIFFCNNIL